jgi:hypothetical protein
MTAMKDELASAVGRIWWPNLKQAGFKRAGKRDFILAVNGIVQLLNLQLSSWGSRTFCVNVAAYTVCGNEFRVLQPGFRLHHPNGAERWLPSKTPEEAASSAEIAWEAVTAQALPWFSHTNTLEGLLSALQSENWGSKHHLHFQIGIICALLGRDVEAAASLDTAINYYLEDPRDWCAAYITRADALSGAIKEHRAATLLAEWYDANKRAHRIT